MDGAVRPGFVVRCPVLLPLVLYDLWRKREKLRGYNKCFHGTARLLPESEKRLVPDLYHIVIHVLIAVISPFVSFERACYVEATFAFVCLDLEEEGMVKCAEKLGFYV